MMVYSPTGISDLFLIMGCMTSDFLYLSFSTLYSKSLWGINTVVFAKLNKHPFSTKPPVSIKPPPPLKWVSNKQAPGGLIDDLRYTLYFLQIITSCFAAQFLLNFVTER